MSSFIGVELKLFKVNERCLEFNLSFTTGEILNCGHRAPESLHFCWIELQKNLAMIFMVMTIQV